MIPPSLLYDKFNSNEYMKSQKSGLKPKPSTLNMRIASKTPGISRTQKTLTHHTSEERLLPLKSEPAVPTVTTTTPLSHKASKQPSNDLHRQHHVNHHHKGHIMKQSSVQKPNPNPPPVPQQSLLTTIHQLKTQLQDKQNTIKFVQETSKSAICDLQKTISQLRKQNQQLKKLDLKSQTNILEIQKMQASSLKCDIAAARSELLMSQKTVERLERELAELRARERLSKVEESGGSRRKMSMALLETRAFGTEITAKCLEMDNHGKAVTKKEFSCSESVIRVFEEQGSVSFELSESSSAFDSKIT